ncbi:MAG: hypothetical protein ACREQN_14815 [Candidatus Binataceae bacterium]
MKTSSHCFAHAVAALASCVLLLGAAPALAQDAITGASFAPNSLAGRALAESATPATQTPTLFAPVADYFANWFTRVSRTQAEQPHWITPLITVTPRLEEEIRYDQSWQSQPRGGAIDNYGSGKGIELIPAERIETILGIPNWISRNRPRGTDGWADETFLMKYRILAANEESGNYIVSAFMGFSAPTAERNRNSAGHALFTPTIAFGKGFGDFDFQTTVSVTFPDGGLDRLGMPVAYNTAFQYRLFRIVWPEFEVNYTWWPDGERAGKSQVYLTPGVVIGRIPIWRRLGFTLGAGYQVAVTDDPIFNHAAVFSARMPF